MYHKFLLKEKQFIKEINSNAYIFEHINSGARLLVLKNDDDNKVFSISFKTPAKDNTGIAHILEHSVLAGSKKYPLKEPFLELVKGSLKTFVNAMTFPDKTMYPVASKNFKDLRNLTDVYLDAVFNPKIKDNPNIFYQEGWRYELENLKNDLTINGVVYNEMKGVFSSPERLVDRFIFKTLFPSTPYGMESGGYPDHIPDLTYEMFFDFYNKYYHPANSYVYLYGDIDIEENLNYLENQYFSKYKKVGIYPNIPIEKGFSNSKKVTFKYPIANNCDLSNKTFLSQSFVIGNILDVELTMAFSSLQAILLDTAASPLKLALLEAHIGQDVYGDFDSSILQPVFSIKAVNANIEDVHKFQSIINDTLKQLVKKGIDKKLIEAVLNRKEFSLREADFGLYPKGLIYNITAMDTWLHGGNPLNALQYEQYLLKLRKGLKENYFEQLINKYFLNNNHSALISVIPVRGLEGEYNRKFKLKLEYKKQSMIYFQLKNLVKETKELKKWQDRIDKEEDLKKIPLLNFEDLRKLPEMFPLEIKKNNDMTIAHTKIFTNNIAYINFYFNMSSISPEDFDYVNLLIRLLGEINTEKRSYIELSNELNIYAGNWTINNGFYCAYKNKNNIYPKTVISIKTLSSNIEKVYSLTAEILINSKFDDKRRLMELIKETRADLELFFMEQGNIVAEDTLLSYIYPIGVYRARSLYPFYNFICALDDNFDKKVESLIEKLKIVSKKLFSQNDLLIHFTGDNNTIKIVKEKLSLFLSNLDSNKGVTYDYNLNCLVKNQALIIPSKVQYVLKGANFSQLGYEYIGSLKVLEIILNYDFLWTNIRVLGGAYGAKAEFKSTGVMFFSSYRDPNLDNTLAIYDKAFEFISKFNPSNREMLKYIIGTLSRVDMPLTAPQKGNTSIDHYIIGKTYENLKEEREQLLCTSPKTIRSLSLMIKNCMEKNIYCVIGGREKINNSKTKFSELIELLK